VIEAAPFMASVDFAPPESYWQMVWRRFRRHKTALFGAWALILILFLSFAGAPIYCAITGTDPLSQNAHERYAFPSGQHWLGTDDYGRDLLARILYGGQASLSVALISAVAAMALGVLVGLVAGYSRGWVDDILMRLTDLMLAIPYLPFYMIFQKALTSSFGSPGYWSMVVIFTAFGWMTIARLVRGAVLSLRETEFVEAARSLGATRWHIMGRHLLLNSMGVIIVSTTLLIASNILMEATLSFLALGIQEPYPSWGNLMMREFSLIFAPMNGPFQLIYAGIPLFIAVLAINFLGDGLRDAIDPKLRI